MAKMDFNSYGGKQEFLETKEGKVIAFTDVSGGNPGHVDAYGDWEKKEKDALDMNAGEAFNKKALTKIDVMGTEYPTKPNASNGSWLGSRDGDHFKAEKDIDPSGTDAGKKTSYQTSTRG